MRLMVRFFLIIAISASYGLLMLSLNGRPLSNLHGVSPYHRYQAFSLLQGHLYLSDSVYAIQPGLAWFNGEVHQVWGMGVGLWLIPFQAIWSMLFDGIFPDRIALGVAFALLCSYTICTALRFARLGQPIVALGFLALVLFFPPLWSLTRTTHLIFEETILYASILSLGILVSLIRVGFFNATTDFYCCCILGTLSWWVRPTHAVYGFCAILIAVLLIYKKPGANIRILLAATIAIISVTLLGWSNNERFGHPLEFGHRLTVSTESMMRLTRFENPYHQALPHAAAVEFFSMLFLNRSPQGNEAFSEGVFPGQANAPRWRRLTFTTFDWTYLLLGLFGIGGIALPKFMKGNQIQKPTVLKGLYLLSAASVFGLATFYLYYPAMASRYLIDFAPAFSGFTIVAWLTLAPRYPKFTSIILGAWLFAELLTAHVPEDASLLTAHPELKRKLATGAGKHIEDFQGIYSTTNHPATSGIVANGLGWTPDSGFARETIALAVDNPQFIELTVLERRAFSGILPMKDKYRAQMAGVFLPLQEVTNTNGELVVHFAVPDSIARSRHMFLFLSFSDSYQADDRRSERILHSVKWR